MKVRNYLFLFLITILLSGMVYALQERKVFFTASVPYNSRTLEMGFHYDTFLWGCATGYEEYNRPCIPADTEGELIIPDSMACVDGRMIPVAWISRGSFQSCPKLTNIRLSKNLLTISDLAFAGCKSLQEITFPYSLEVIFPRAFIGCTALRRITFLSPEPPRSYNNDTFDEVTYATATLVVPAQSSELYLNDPISYRFRYHAEELPLYTDTKP